MRAATRLFALTALTATGCATAPPSKTAEGAEALAHLAAATAALPNADSDPVTAEKARSEAEACFHNVEHLNSMRGDLAGGRAYDPDKDTLETAEGPQTLNHVLQRCKDLTMTRRKTLPTPAASDPVLERAMLDAAKSAGWNPRALVITSDWAIDRHPRSGIVVGRSRVAAIAFSHTDGTCRYSLVDFFGNEAQVELVRQPRDLDSR